MILPLVSLPGNLSKCRVIKQILSTGTSTVFKVNVVRGPCSLGACRPIVSITMRGTNI